MPLQRRPRPVAETLTVLWFPRLWLPFVVAATLGYWVLATHANPATVGTWAILLVFWILMVGWYQVHIRLPALSVDWFAAYTLVVILFGIGGLWSAGFLMTRHQALLRDTSPDRAVTVVVTGAAWDRVVDVSAETTGGLLLDRAARLEFAGGPNDPRRGVPETPRTFSLAWAPDRRLVALRGDDRNLAIFDYEGGQLREQAALRFDEAAIARRIMP